MVTNKAKESPRSYNVSTEFGKELRRNRSHIRQIPQKPSKHVSFGMRNNQFHQFTPNTERMMAKTTPCQTKHRDSPPLDSDPASSSTRGTTQPTNLNPEPEALAIGAHSPGGRYVTSNLN